MTIAPSAIDACKGKEAVIIATEWKEFLELNWQSVYDHMSKPAFVFDGRLLVDADKLRQIGFKVSSLLSALSVKIADDVHLQVKVIGRGERV